ncbi:MAG: hypothetical protein WCJ58_07955 [bacterium]
MLKNSDEPPSSSYKEVTLFLSNISEDVWPFIQAITDPAKRKYEIAENANLVDQHLFSITDEPNIIFVTPKAIDPDFVEYFQSLINIKSLKIISPKNHTGEICMDLIHDLKLFHELIADLKGYSRIKLKSYSASHQFYRLKNELLGFGLNVIMTEAPEDDASWTINFFGSKSGIRQLAQKSGGIEPDLIMPDGLIVVGTFEASRIAADKYIENDGVVIKTNKGHSGAGVLIFREGDLPSDYEACQQRIHEILSQDAYWEKFPIIIEDLVNVNSAVGGGFPSIEFKIKKNGDVDYLYYGGLIVTKEGVFKGMEINDDVINERIYAQIMDVGYYIGEEYARAGYRGYYDVDMIAAKNHKIYVSESNVRRTGATHVYKTALKLFDDDFMYKTYIVSNNNYNLPGVINLPFNDLLVKLKELLFNPRKKEGIVILSKNIISQKGFAYIIFAKNKKKAFEYQDKLYKKLARLVEK